MTNPGGVIFTLIIGLVCMGVGFYLLIHAVAVVPISYIDGELDIKFNSDLVLSLVAFIISLIFLSVGTSFIQELKAVYHGNRT